MSKLLAMMMKPKPIMYATIKGSLTESPSGVFSGFSSSDYLALQQQFDLNKDFEICINFTTSNDFTDPQLLLGYVLSGTEARLQIRYFTETGSIQITNSSLGSSISIARRLSENTNYKVIWKKENNVGSLSLYDSNNNLLGSNSTEYTNIETSSLVNLFLGVRASSSHASVFTGSIDLNYSYIKLQNTKYRLQAVVGYIQVGSPTITDGVVSGMGSSDYLETPAFSPQNKKWEIITKFTTGNESPTVKGIITGLGSTNSFAPLYVDGQNRVCFYLSSNGTSWDIASGLSIVQLSINTTYIIKIEYTGLVYNAYSFENNQWLLKKTVNNSTQIYGTIPLVFGNNRGNSSAFNGSIDMNNTYIKINNKLWFNGQEG